jgi:hypothetical protein
MHSEVEAAEVVENIPEVEMRRGVLWAGVHGPAEERDRPLVMPIFVQERAHVVRRGAAEGGWRHVCGAGEAPKGCAMPAELDAGRGQREPDCALC